MSFVFTDSISSNVELLQMLLQDCPPNTRGEAKRAAVAVEKVIDGLRRDGRGNQGAALGTAFALFMLAQRFVEDSAEKGGSSGDGLIQLLS